MDPHASGKSIHLPGRTASSGVPLLTSADVADAAQPTDSMDGSDDLTPVVLPKKPSLNLSDKSVPEINVESLPLDSAEAQSKFAESLRATFFDKSGCVILRNVFKPNIMNEYNSWCGRHFDEVTKTHANCRHPKQSDKITINDVMERMSLDNPDLLMSLLRNSSLNRALDALLGFARFGAVTCHCIEPGGDRQKSHVDFPCHVRSGAFWEDDPDMLKQYFTSHQLNHVLPHFSVQALIASDTMGKFNGECQSYSFGLDAPHHVIRCAPSRFNGSRSWFAPNSRCGHQNFG
eukprot:m.189670 g.189670  ORF g.189670 m.189670 type:complete len:290 (-) comp15114_c0_seq5:390-1259(-)